ncbi:MAG: molybdenum cofactor biosynthesis protein MoaE, partial [Sphingobacteriales bacterium]
MIDIKILEQPLDILFCIDWVTSADCGGLDVFIGTVRNATKGKQVLQLEFEAYPAMAVKELEKIVQQAFEQWPVQKVLVHHRTGILQIGEVPVVIAVSAAHRAAAFDACRYIIDTLKQ